MFSSSWWSWWSSDDHDHHHGRPENHKFLLRLSWRAISKSKVTAFQVCSTKLLQPNILTIILMLIWYRCQLDPKVLLPGHSIKCRPPRYPDPDYDHDHDHNDDDDDHDDHHDDHYDDDHDYHNMTMVWLWQWWYTYWFIGWGGLYRVQWVSDPKSLAASYKVFLYFLYSWVFLNKVFLYFSYSSVFLNKVFLYFSYSSVFLNKVFLYVSFNWVFLNQNVYFLP